MNWEFHCFKLNILSLRANIVIGAAALVKTMKRSVYCIWLTMIKLFGIPSKFHNFTKWWQNFKLVTDSESAYFSGHFDILLANIRSKIQKINFQNFDFFSNFENFLLANRAKSGMCRYCAKLSLMRSVEWHIVCGPTYVCTTLSIRHD